MCLESAGTSRRSQSPPRLQLEGTSASASGLLLPGFPASGWAGTSVGARARAQHVFASVHDGVRAGLIKPQVRRAPSASATVLDGAGAARVGRSCQAPRRSDW